MSIEQTLEQIRVSLCNIERMMSIQMETPLSHTIEKKVEPPVPTPVVPPVPRPPVKKADPVEESLTVEQLNEELMKCFEQLKGEFSENKAQFDNIIKKHGASSLSDLDKSKYNDVLSDIRKYVERSKEA